jgi:hypothetical protein
VGLDLTNERPVGLFVAFDVERQNRVLGADRLKEAFRLMRIHRKVNCVELATVQDSGNATGQTELARYALSGAFSLLSVECYICHSIVS